MATRLGSSIVLMIGLLLVPQSSRAQGVDGVKNSFGLARHRLRNLAASVRERLDDIDAREARAGENRRRLMDQKTAVSKVEMGYQEAKLAEMIAETAVMEYEQGTSKQQLETIEGNIAMAKAELKRAEDRIEETKNRVEETKALVERIGQMPKETIGELMSEYYAGQNRKSAENQFQAARFDLDRAKLALEQAETSKEVLLKFTKEKTLKGLRAEVEKAKSNMFMKQAELLLARDVEARLEREGGPPDGRDLTPAEKAALARFGALEAPWRAILGRRDAIEKDDPAGRDEIKRKLDDFTKALDEADRAWSAAREARLDDRDASLMHLFRPAR